MEPRRRLLPEEDLVEARRRQLLEVVRRNKVDTNGFPLEAAATVQSSKRGHHPSHMEATSAFPPVPLGLGPVNFWVTECPTGKCHRIQEEEQEEKEEEKEEEEEVSPPLVSLARALQAC